MGYQVYRFTWNGIEIEARYNPLYANNIAHLEIETITPERAPLPITETGYRSHFHPSGMIENNYDGDLIAAVTDWLNVEAKTKHWQYSQEKNNQLSLF